MSDSTYRRIVLSAITVTGILLYMQTLNYSLFLFDGELFLKNNPLFKDLDFYTKLLDIPGFSRLDEQLGLHQDVTTNFMMRPVAYMSFTLNYLLNGFDAAAFRSVNIALHIFNSLFVFSCVELLLSIPASRRSLSRFSARFIPATTAFVFLLHPMQTESVTYITQRFSSLGAMFYLMTIWLYLFWTSRQRRGETCAYLRWMSVLTLLLGMLTRESLFTAPFMLILLEITVLGSAIGPGLKRVAPHVLLLPMIPLMTIIVSASQNDSSPTFSAAINAVNYDSVPVVHYALSQLVIVISYLRLYLVPHGQNVDPDPTLYTQPFQLPVIGAALTIAFMVGGTYFLHRKYREDVRYRLLFAGVCWYFLGLAVSSSFIPLPDLMAEHRAYFPSAGFLMALISFLDILRTNLGVARSGKLLVAGTAAWCAILIVLTHSRNNVWQSRIQLWSDSVRKSPLKERPWYNLGTSYLKKGDYTKAQICFEKVININPAAENAYERLAALYLQLGQYQNAIQVSLQGIEIAPANPVLYGNLGIAYAELEREDDAREAFSMALVLRPNYEKARLNLARLESFIESSVSSQSQPTQLTNSMKTVLPD